MFYFLVKLSCKFVTGYDKIVKLMTILREKNKTSNVHLHTEKAYALLDAFLPSHYVELVQERFKIKYPEKAVPSSGTLRNVKNRVNKSSERRIDIINVMVEIAADNKKACNDLEKAIT